MSGCPVDHGARTDAGDCPAGGRPADGSGGSGECPADHGQSLRAFAGQALAMDPHNNMPLVPEQHGSRGLSTERTVSSIPRAERYEAAGPSECPAVDGTKEMWIYPSEQMFFNAMRRKNWDPKARDMKTVVPIHNTVNEECWRQIMDWEKRHASACGAPKLLRFEGKAKQTTPKAWLRSLVGYQRPFDRHDWTVDRCGTRVTYVIDFYEGRRDPNNPHATSFFLDVRPALTASGAWDRACRLFGF